METGSFGLIWFGSRFTSFTPKGYVNCMRHGHRKSNRGASPHPLANPPPHRCAVCKARGNDFSVEAGSFAALCIRSQPYRADVMGSQTRNE